MASSQKIDLNSKNKNEESDDESENIQSELMNDTEDDISINYINDDDDDDDDDIDDDDDDADVEGNNNDVNMESSENIDNIKTDTNDDIYDEEDIDIFDYNDPDIEINLNKRVPDNERITVPRLTKYERVRILGTRAKQISDGSKVFIKSNKVKNAMDIAELELEYKVVPLKIKRPLPNGKYEIWSIRELEII